MYKRGIMNLDNFSEQLKTTVDAAFNYAKENNFAYFTSLHILIVLIQSDKLVLEILDYSISILYCIPYSEIDYYQFHY